jgi:hypothetical protein
MRERIRGTTTGRKRAAAEKWLAWVSEYRAAVDPLRHSLTMPLDRKPTTEDLKPFLRGWSPYGPDI